eukprot:TRINITY_DN3366_c0_g1_i1.p1 TRINITY_DN3366_c0_g1~~TRINITY_DN3366_c0_g1_i1.p1  ORF type:complete len:248 (-),score=82.74 TRINITY_DN3366_c0_g1_i1:58-801(-)
MQQSVTDSSTQMHPQSLHLKINLNQEFHRITLPREIEYEEFHHKILSLFNLRKPEHYSLKYKDEEDDLISLSSQFDLDEFIKYNENLQHHLLRIALVRTPTKERSLIPKPSVEITTLMKISEEIPLRASPLPIVFACQMPILTESKRDSRQEKDHQEQFGCDVKRECLERSLLTKMKISESVELISSRCDEIANQIKEMCLKDSEETVKSSNLLAPQELLSGLTLSDDIAAQCRALADQLNLERQSP